MNDIYLRDVTINDEALVFEWRNIDALIALSSNQKKVTLKEHQQWFGKKILDLNCKFIIVQLNSISIGLIRLELERGECKITIYLIPGYEGQGFGYKALSKMIDNCTLGCKSYLAEVQKKNISSQNLFLKCGFSKVSENDTLILYKKINLSK